MDRFSEKDDYNQMMTPMSRLPDAWRYIGGDHDGYVHDGNQCIGIARYPTSRDVQSLR